VKVSVYPVAGGQRLMASTFCLCVARPAVCLSHMTHLRFTGIEPTARQHDQ